MSEHAIPEISNLLRDPSTYPAQLPSQGLVTANLVRVNFVVPIVAIGYTFLTNDSEESCPCVKPTQLQTLIQMEVGLHE